MGMLETVTQKIKEAVWWHEDMVEDFAEKYNLSIYQASWISFIKAVIIIQLKKPPAASSMEETESPNAY
jgi:hypothetical protein